MTRNEILNMPAGREMDALIAEKVMGWSWDKYKRVYRIDPKDNSLFGVCWGDNDAPNGYFEPSTNISAAWEVVEKLSVDGTQFYICTNFSGMNNGKFYVTIGRNILESFSVYESFADTAPLAICRAALLAVMEEQNE